MNPSRGFVSFGLILAVVIGLVVLGGGAWYATNNKGAATSTPQATTDTDEVGCAGRDAMKPFITAITPASGPVGTEIEIKGCNLSGFEADLEAAFERSDGVLIPIYAGTLYRKTPEIAEYQEMKLTLQSYCPSGRVIGLYSGLEQQCQPVVASPGEYKVSVHTPSGTSNSVNFIVQ